jgi:hypothetical protein
MEYDSIWETLHLASGIYNVGDAYPNKDFDFYIEGVSETNVYCSNRGIEQQIKDSLNNNPEKQKIVYFYYKRNDI